MGRGPDKKPRATPNRVYATVPDEEAARMVAVTPRPYHLFFLNQMTMEVAGISPRIQKLIEEMAQGQGIGIEDWEVCEEKQKYIKGVRGSNQAQLEKRKQKRRERTP